MKQVQDYLYFCAVSVDSATAAERNQRAGNCVFNDVVRISSQLHGLPFVRALEQELIDHLKDNGDWFDDSRLCILWFKRVE